MTLENFFHDNSKTALGFSGGVDSAYLLYAGLCYGADIRPYYIKTAFQPQFELDDALRFTEKLGIELKIINLDILSLPIIASNPTDRCYHCKLALFGILKNQALKDGYSVLIDGTNASDDVCDRPGMNALRKLSVYSPLSECGMTKNLIRQLSKNAGLFTWDKPAYACLATRIPSGETITDQVLNSVEKAENALSQLGFSDFRVRVFHGAARVQILSQQMETAIALTEKIKEKISPYFPVVLLDLNGR